jgi:hypothetical protein
MKVVYLDDRNMRYEEAYKHFADVARWAQENCSSFVGYDVQDVSDVSLIFDNVAEYKFRNNKDVVLFTLKWK